MVKFFKYILFVFLCLLGTISIFLSACYIMGPPPIDMEVTTIFYDQSDEALEPMTDQQTLSLDEVPTTILTATVITEDRNFYSHYGFDFKGIIRAIWKNIKTQSLKEGASTITQQYARNLYLTHEKTWLRKVKEAFYTIRLEMFYTKEEILTGYLHAIYYGHGAYGIEEASQVYFDKNASELTLAESAMLAGIPKGPTYYSPFNDEEKAINRQKGILKQMLQADLITQADYYEAIEETLEFDEPHVQEESFANFFTDTVLKEASTLLHGDEQVVLSGNYHIYTTLDKDYQQQLEKLVMEDVAEKSELEIGVLSIDSKSGAIIGLMGGTSYKDSSFNRVIEAKRMVGSTFKPFVYYTALEQGFTPSTMLLSEPTTFELEENQTYEPKNYNGYYAYA
ncbi:MAG TPA: transglycosylase domain-containing protein, partial [Pseudogracilibacillus sp.]|nr:transglycosylase domain-containing protein [Pseudogracilibacillus sp.]